MLKNLNFGFHRLSNRQQTQIIQQKSWKNTLHLIWFGRLPIDTLYSSARLLKITISWSMLYAAQNAVKKNKCYFFVTGTAKSSLISSTEDNSSSTLTSVAKSSHNSLLISFLQSQHFFLRHKSTATNNWWENRGRRQEHNTPKSTCIKWLDLW